VQQFPKHLGVTLLKKQLFWAGGLGKNRLQGIANIYVSSAQNSRKKSSYAL
jgi:hypothetical protein